MAAQVDSLQANQFLSPLKSLNSASLNKIFLGVLVASIILGLGSGFLLAKTGGETPTKVVTKATAPSQAQQDSKTFRDFAQGVVQKRPNSKKADAYAEGTHILVREGAVPVALTSSVVDLSEYEGKKVKVFGETQKAIKEGWLMDVGKVEIEK